MSAMGRACAEDRFEKFVMPEPNTGCWLWTGCTTRGGYAVFGKVLAHRFSYEAFVGPIPDGLEIDHKCRVRCCVNPGHLESVTRLENILRGSRASVTHCPQGHPYSGRNLIIHGERHRLCRACINARRALSRKKQKEQAA